MPRPFCCRRVQAEPPSTFFKPRGIPLAELEAIVLAVDEFEAVRLADLEGLYQEDAARRMGISRPTFGRIIESAHRKIAEALVNGKALEIRGGEIEMVNERKFTCGDCQHQWQVPYGTGRPDACPQCQSRNVHRAPEERGRGRQRRCRQGQGQGRGRGRGMRHGWGRRGHAMETDLRGGEK